MNGSRTALKIITAIMIIFALLEIVVGAILLLGAKLPEFATTLIFINGQVMTEATASLGLGIGFVAIGIVHFIIGMLGWRGAKRPSKIGPFFWLSVIGAVLSVVGLVMAIAQGSVSTVTIVSTVVVVICAILANSIRNGSKRMGSNS